MLVGWKRHWRRGDSQQAREMHTRRSRNNGVDTGVVYVYFLPLFSSSHTPQSPLPFPSTNTRQPFSVGAGLLFLASGAALIFYFRYEKARMERKRIAEAAKGVGKPKVGGPFTLTDQYGKPFSSEKDMKGKYALVYFGFTHCPDICPEELDKMAVTLDILSKQLAGKNVPEILPVFITCDPARDTPAVLEVYLKEFHKDLVGLTGTWEQIKDVCKKYRVYFSTPEGVKKGEDYLVDHSIYFYLMDPEGDFVEAIGRQHGPEQAAALIRDHVKDWKR